MSHAPKRFGGSSPLALAGMAGLAVLSATDWARGAGLHPGAVLGFLLGVLPNLAAGYAMPLIVASMVGAAPAEREEFPDARRFMRTCAFTTLGLWSWEFIQARSPRFVFDVNDLVATGVGAALAYFTYRGLARTRSVPSPTS